MTTDHDDTSFPPDPWSADRRDVDQADFWGGKDDWATPVRAEPDDTTSRMRRPGGVLGAVGKWADRTLSGGVEPTRSHRAVRTPADDVPTWIEPVPVDRAPRATQYDPDRVDAERHVERRTDVEPGPDSMSTGERWDDERWDAGWDVAPVAAPRPGVDPLLARLGGLAVVLTLLVPLLLGMRSDGDDGQLRDAGVVTADVESTAPLTSVRPAGGTFVASDVASPAPAEVDATTDAPAPTSATVDDTAVGDDADPSVTAQASALGDSSEQTTTATTVRPISEPAQADDPADRLEPVCGAEYEVAAGDFWLRLADAAGVDLDDLLALNDATTDTALFPGQSICLPAGARTPAPPVTAAPSTAPVTAAPSTAAPTTAAPTTAAPTTTAPPTPTAPGDVEQIIRDVWPDDLEDRALEIAWRESNYIPTAKNFCCYGLFQIYWEVHRGWLAELGVTSAEQLYDPTTNARAALTLYQRAGGWGPWGF